MASDLKIEMFASELFNTMWCINNVIESFPHILDIYGCECVGGKSYVDACDALFTEAMSCRNDIFCLVNERRNSIEEIKNLKSLSDVNEYIIRKCDRDDMFGHLTVFGRMLATSELAAEICLLINAECEHFIDVVRYGHIIWAMYFEKFTAEFYEKGGWSELKREAKRYKLLIEFDRIFCDYTDYYLSRAEEATINYFRFKNNVDFRERKYNHKVHVSKLWIQFQIEHFESYVLIPISFGTHASFFEVEHLVQDIMKLLDCTKCISDDIKILKENHQGSIFSAKVSHSKNECASEEMNANPKNDMQIQNLNFENESKIIDKTSDTFSFILENFKGMSQNVSETSVIKESTFKVMETNDNSELDKNIDDMKDNSSDDMKIQNLSFESQGTIINKTSDEFSPILGNFKGVSHNRSETVVVEESTFIIETNKNLELDKKALLGIDFQRNESSSDRTKDFHIEQHLLTAVNTKKVCEKTTQNLPTASDLDSSLNCRRESPENTNDNITRIMSNVKSDFGHVGPYFEYCERNADKPTDIINMDQVVSYHHIEKTECHKYPSSNYRAMSGVSDNVNKRKNNGNETENCEDMMEMKSCSKDGHIKTSEQKDDFSEIQIDAPDKFGFSIELSVNKNAKYANECESILRVEDLRNEEKDPEVRNLLRMLLVVGDKERTKFILSMLKNKEQPKNSQKSINKKKKKRK